MCSIWSRWSYTSKISGNTRFLCELLRKFMIINQILHHRLHRVLDVHGWGCENSLVPRWASVLASYAVPTTLYIFFVKRKRFFGEGSCESSSDSELKAGTPQFLCLLSKTRQMSKNCNHSDTNGREAWQWESSWRKYMFSRAKRRRLSARINFWGKEAFRTQASIRYRGCFMTMADLWLQLRTFVPFF